MFLFLNHREEDRMFRFSLLSAILVSLLLGGISGLSFIIPQPALFLFSNVFFFLAVRSFRSIKLTVVCAGLYSLAMYSSGLYILLSLSQGFDDSYSIVIWFVNSLIILALVALFVFVVFLLKLLSKSSNVVWFIILLPSFLIFHEWLKTFVLTGFPWFQASDLLVDLLNVEYSIVGALGVSFIFYTFIGLLCLLFIAAKRKEGIYSSLALFLGLVVSCVLAHELLYTQIYSEDNTEETILVKLMNTKISSKNKNSIRYSTTQLLQYQDIAMLEPKADLVILPEGIIQRSLAIHPSNVTKGFEKLKENGIYVLSGGYDEDFRGEYNTVYSNVKNKSVYTKQHLIPFGEYMPKTFSFLSSVFPDINQGNLSTKNYYSGTIKIANQTVAPIICFELFFSDELRKKANSAGLIVVFTDLGFLKDDWSKRYMLDVARIRAMEFSKPLVQSANFSITAFIDKKGKVLKSTQATDSPYIQNTVDLNYSKSIFGRYPYSIFILLAFNIFITVLTLFLYASIKKRKYYV